MVPLAVQQTRRHALPPRTQQTLRMLRPVFLLPLLWLLLLCLHSRSPALVSAQLAFLVPDTCPLQRFDISSLSCVSCPAHASVASSDLWSEQCVCNAGYSAVLSATDAYGFTCSDCISSGLAARSDRTACMPCSTTQGAVLSTITRDCVCPAGHILGTRTRVNAARATACAFLLLLISHVSLFVCAYVLVYVFS